MHRNPKVSIIIPVYNTEKYLPRLFKSLFKQTLKEFELIVIDDGSVDKSLEILQNYALQDKRIKVFSQENKGQSVCRNRGLSLAKAPYICFVDSDDTIEKEMLQVLYTAIVNDKSDIVTTSYKTFYLDGTYTVTSREMRDSKNISNPALSGYIWGQLYKKSLFQFNNIFFPEGIYFEDQLTALELYFYASKISTINKPLYNYYINSNSTTQKISQKKIDDIFDVIDRMETFLKDKSVFTSHKTNIQAKLLKLINNYILSYLIKTTNEKLLKYFIQKARKSNKITKPILKKLSIQHFGLYFDFVTKIFLAKKNHIETNLSLETFIEPSILSVLELQYLQNKDISFAQLALYYLQKNNISKIIVYGNGKIYQEMQPLLDKQGIEVVNIIDNNEALTGSITLKQFLSMQGYSTKHPFLITSIAYAPEIESTLRQNLSDPNIISARSLLMHF